MNEHEKITPSYYAILSADVRYCKDLEPGAKLLYAEITALTNQYGFCWASNRHFSELYDVDIRTIQRWLESLSRNNFINVEIMKDGFKSLRRIYLSESFKKIDTTRQKCHDGMTKMSVGHDKNVIHNIKENTTKKIDLISARPTEENFIHHPEKLIVAKKKNSTEVVSISVKELTKQLKAEKFTDEQIEYAISEFGKNSRTLSTNIQSYMISIIKNRTEKKEVKTKSKADQFVPNLEKNKPSNYFAEGKGAKELEMLMRRPSVLGMPREGT